MAFFGLGTVFNILEKNLFACFLLDLKQVHWSYSYEQFCVLSEGSYGWDGDDMLCTGYVKIL
jgi:hypothetical protein